MEKAKHVDIIPVVPEEERKVYSQIQECYKELLQNKNNHSLHSLSMFQVKLEDLSQELVNIRREFKRLRQPSQQEMSEINALVDNMQISESQHRRSQHLSSKLRQSIPTAISMMTKQRTPTDILLAQSMAFIDQLVNPLLEKLSPIMFPVYAQLDSIFSVLDSYKYTGAYTIDGDIISIQKKLRQIENEHVVDGKFVIKVKNAPQDHNSIPSGQAILFAKLNACYRLVHLLIAQVESLAPSLAPVHEQLVRIYKRLNLWHHSVNPTSYSNSDILDIQQQLRAIDSLRHHEADKAAGPGSFLELDSSIPAGQALVIELLETCFDLAHSLLSIKDPIVGGLRVVYEELISHRQRLSDLFSNRHLWLIQGITESVYFEVTQIQRHLKEIDGKRVDGKFLGSGETESDGIAEGQAILHFVLHKCYRLVYKILFHMSMLAPKSPFTAALTPHSSVYIDESLLPFHRQLITIRRCLLELKKHAPWMEEDLIPWKSKLLSMNIDRKDGLFQPPSSFSSKSAFSSEEDDLKRLSSVSSNTNSGHSPSLKKKRPIGYDLVGALWDECFELLTEMEVMVEQGKIVGIDGESTESSSAEENNNRDDDDDGDEEEEEEGGRDYGRLNSYRPFPVTNFFSTKS